MLLTFLQLHLDFSPLQVSSNLKYAPSGSVFLTFLHHQEIHMLDFHHVEHRQTLNVHSREQCFTTSFTPSRNTYSWLSPLQASSNFKYALSGTVFITFVQPHLRHQEIHILDFHHVKHHQNLNMYSLEQTTSFISRNRTSQLQVSACNLGISVAYFLTTYSRDQFLTLLYISEYYHFIEFHWGCLKWWKSRISISRLIYF